MSKAEQIIEALLKSYNRHWINGSGSYDRITPTEVARSIVEAEDYLQNTIMILHRQQANRLVKVYRSQPVGVTFPSTRYFHQRV